VNYREFIRMIEKDGWKHVRTTGSHKHYHHPAKPGTVTVAGQGNDDIPRGTLDSMLKQAGLKQWR
jgi:predicted RNA binding protein YcfA (HicA-like mRNA interferase family)